MSEQWTQRGAACSPPKALADLPPIGRGAVGDPSSSVAASCGPLAPLFGRQV